LSGACSKYKLYQKTTNFAAEQRLIAMHNRREILFSKSYQGNAKLDHNIIKLCNKIIMNK